jgi:hypothetical protein
MHFVCLLLLLGLLVGCNKSPTSPSPNPTATPTTVPGAGTVPTATPNKTATANATANATLTPGVGGSPTATPTVVVAPHNIEYIVSSSDTNFVASYVGTDYLPHLVSVTTLTTWSSGLLTKYTKDMANLTVYNGNTFSITATLTIKEDGVVIAQSPTGGQVIATSGYIEVLVK